MQFCAGYDFSGDRRLKEIPKGPNFSEWATNAIRNSEQDGWPSAPVNDSRLFKSRFMRLIRPQPEIVKGWNPGGENGLKFFRFKSSRKQYQTKFFDPLFVPDEDKEEVMTVREVNAVEGNDLFLANFMGGVEDPPHLPFLPGPYRVESENDPLFIQIRSVFVQNFSTVSKNDARAEGMLYDPDICIGTRNYGTEPWIGGWRASDGAWYPSHKYALGVTYNKCYGRGTMEQNPWMWTFSVQHISLEKAKENLA